jgi:hypothetical protein
MTTVIEESKTVASEPNKVFVGSMMITDVKTKKQYKCKAAIHVDVLALHFNAMIDDHMSSIELLRGLVQLVVAPVKSDPPGEVPMLVEDHVPVPVPVPSEVSVAQGGPTRLEHLKILWHSLGMEKRNYRRKLSWWLDDDKHRNYFSVDCCLNSDYRNPDFKLIEDLVARGLMKLSREHEPGKLSFYHVTPDGVTLAKTEFNAKP